LGGDVSEVQSLVEIAPRIPGVEVRLGTEAKSINRDEKFVEIQDRKTQRTDKVQYDKLIICTGSLALRPPIPGMDLQNVFTLRTVKDCEELLKAVPKAKRAALVGAGPVGVETACALKARGLETTVVEMQPSVFPGMLDPDMSEEVMNKLRQVGVQTICGKAVKEIRGKGKVSSVLAEDQQIQADIVVVAVGVKPDVELAVQAGLELGPTGLISVDDHLRTSDPDIYAAGDCAETKFFFTELPIKSQLATTAIRMGRAAGINAAGGDESFPGVLNSVVSSVCGMEIATTGLNTNVAKAVGFDAVSVRIRASSRPHFYPGAEPIIVKLVVEKSRRILGGQIIGDGAAERVNLLSLAITQGVTVDKLAKMEYCYAPPVNDCIEPLVMAAEAVLRRL
jgi:NADPH-dependent 2,4-dienoyl-CoA reductase/sulfur reductase-like enzyme